MAPKSTFQKSPSNCLLSMFNVFNDTIYWYHDTLKALLRIFVVFYDLYITSSDMLKYMLSV